MKKSFLKIKSKLILGSEVLGIKITRERKTPGAKKNWNEIFGTKIPRDEMACTVIAFESDDLVRLHI